ncbi:MAG: hypothetical protein H6905_09735 [Hyphomicrobiales bacterium]|nr:hypothetical protein [Hyphomicrobiales bacterium]
MKPCVFIQTNHKQMLGAVISEYSIRRNSQHNDAFDIRIMDCADFPFLEAREGQTFLRDGISRVWRIDDLQSFTPLRFLPPELMGYEGRAIVIDPDVFAVSDIFELLSRDMQGQAIMCRARPGRKGLASSVMLLDCAKLTHWDCERQFGELFEFKRDYMDWVCLRTEPEASICLFENEWNDFDHLSEKTKLLHNTKRWTQPWKTGLPVDFLPTERSHGFPPLGWLRRARRTVFGTYSLLGRYKKHGDPNQERFFFGLLREALDKGIVTEGMLRREMARNHLRHDAFELLERVPPLAA